MKTVKFSNYNYELIVGENISDEDAIALYIYNAALRPDVDRTLFRIEKENA